MRGRELLENWFHRVWIEGDFDAVDRMFAPDTAAEGVLDFALSGEDFKALAPAFLALVDAPRLSFERVVEHGDWVAALLRIRAQRRDNGETIEVIGQIMARVQGGVFVEAYNTFDTLGFLTQIGALPPDTLALALIGESLAG